MGSAQAPVLTSPTPLTPARGPPIKLTPGFQLLPPSSSVGKPCLQGQKQSPGETGHPPFSQGRQRPVNFFTGEVWRHCSWKETGFKPLFT